jgi:hypothetical protein
MVRPAGFEQRVWFLPTIASATLAPTVAEITAGTEITGDLPAPVNFSATTNFIDVSDIGDQQDKQQTGTTSLGDLSFEIYRDKTSEVAKDALDNGINGYLVKFEGGNIAGANPAAADVADVAAVTIGIKTDVTSPRNDSRRLSVPIGVRDAIAWDVAVLA